MPKKPNRKDLQEYVPAGNGDASGEYADEGGSNTHFTSFKKPQEQKPTESTSSVPQQPKVNTKPTNSLFDDIKHTPILTPMDRFKKRIYEDDLKRKRKEAMIESKTKSNVLNKREQLEQDWKTKHNFKGSVNFEGLNEKKTKECLTAYDDVSRDFPFIGDVLETFGTNKGIEIAARKELEEIKKSSNYKKLIEDKKAELERLNPDTIITYDYAKSTFDRLFTNEDKYRNLRGNFWGATTNDGKAIRIKNTNYQSLIDRGYGNHQPPYNATLSMYGTMTHELGHVVSSVLFKSSLWGFGKNPHDIEEIYRHNRNKVSVYGGQSINEFVSECFASHYSHQQNEVAELVFQLVKKHYNDYKTRSGMYEY